MSKKTRIPYLTLQKRYPGQIVALSQKEDVVLASGQDVIEVEEKLEKKGLKPEKAIFLGPIEEYGRICVY